MLACFIIRVTSTEDLVSGGTGDVDDIQAGGSNTMAPSQIQQPRIVFTGVSGAMMGKMKEVGRTCALCNCQCN